MAKSAGCTFKQVSHACKWPRHSLKTNSNQNKTQFLISGKTRWSTTRSRPRSHTSLPRCGLDGHIQGHEVEKIWVSLSWRTRRTWRTWTWGRWMQRSWFAITKIRDFMLWIQNMDLCTHIQGSCENKHKNMNLNANFLIKQDFFFKNTWTLFSQL